MLALAQGRSFPAARLSLRKPGTAGGAYLEYHLEMVGVTSYEVSHSAGEPPTESVKLAFGKVSQRYSPTGNLAPASRDIVSANWSRITNTGGLGGFPDVPVQ